MKDVELLAFVAAGMGAVTALFAALRERGAIARWCFVSGMLVFTLESVFCALAGSTTHGDEAVKYWQQWRLVALSFLPGIWLLFSLSYGRGNAREFLSRWRFVLVVAFVLPVSLAAFCFSNLIRIVYFTQPVVTGYQLTSPGLLLYALFLIFAVLVLVNLERTFRAAIGTMRWRIKFMIVGLGVLFAVRVYTGSQILLWPKRGMDPLFLKMDAAGLILGSVLLWRSLVRSPVEVAVYPPFAILQRSAIVLLAGIYLIVVGVYAKYDEFVGVDISFPAKAFSILLVLVGVTLAGLSDRVRLYARRFASRYLQRPLYDYQTVWRKFNDAIASRVKQEDLCEAAVREVADVFQAMSVTVWLLDEKRENFIFAASTSLSPVAGGELAPQKEAAAAVIKLLQERSEPRDIESSKETWAVALRRCHPTQFRSGAARVCVPMMAGPQLMGVMTLGDRVGGMFFTLQDFDLLKCVADQVGAGLLNSQLSQRLVQAKEMEAFQTMSAFFVHDLKNTASTLNLMLKNLPVHFDNPAFREDALRGVAKTCDHINHLISRLSLLRHDLQIRPAQSDLTEVVSKALATLNGVSPIALVKNINPCPKLLLDQEQMHKVVTNLVINATEAVGRDGRVVIETSQSNGWAILTVSDNGCGMDPEFVRRTLFRPFQSTKKNGFGIGMFQSKMIVEAHGGSIEVESELKKGTTFRVLLPVQKQ